MKRMMKIMLAAGVAAVGVIGIGVGTPSALADGTITGKVNFDGKMNKPRKVRVKGDAICVKSHSGNPLYKETYLFNVEKKTLRNVIVYVSGGLSGTHTVPTETVAIEQEGCQFIPHVSAAMVGQKVTITNHDNTAHNLNLKAVNNPMFNEGQPVKGMVKTVTFANEEVAIPLKCDVHAWMIAYIAVFDHPYFAVTDENGEFKIEGLPAGNYELSTWHEFDKFTPTAKSISVTVTDGGTATADFTYRPPGK